jgi:hypothetical protein
MKWHSKHVCTVRYPRKNSHYYLPSSIVSQYLHIRLLNFTCTAVSQLHSIPMMVYNTWDYKVFYYIHPLLFRRTCFRNWNCFCPQVKGTAALIRWVHQNELSPWGSKGERSVSGPGCFTLWKLSLIPTA